VLVRQVPDFGSFNPQVATRRRFAGLDYEVPTMSLADFEEQRKTRRSFFRKLEAEGLSVWDPASGLILTGGYYSPFDGELPLYWDGNHLSYEGSLRVANNLLEVLSR
jgi:hypothetical protein